MMCSSTVPASTINNFIKKYPRGTTFILNYFLFQTKEGIKKLKAKLSDRKTFERFKKRVKLLTIYYYSTHQYELEADTRDQSKMKRIIRMLDEYIQQYLKALYCPRMSSILKNGEGCKKIGGFSDGVLCILRIKYLHPKIAKINCKH